MKHPALGSLAHEVRTLDYERFLAIQLAPAPVREALYALTAFSGELARIGETIREPMLRAIRFAWWREALEEIVTGAAAREHPVLQAMANAYAAQPSLFTHCFTMLEARAAQAEEGQPATEAQWHAQLRDTAGALHLAWAGLLDGEAAIHHRAEILQAAQEYAQIGLLRSIPHLHGTGQLPFPRDALANAALKNLAESPALSAWVLQRMQTLKLTNVAHKSLPSLYVFVRLSKLHRRRLGRAGGNPYKLRYPRIRAIMYSFASSGG